MDLAGQLSANAFLELTGKLSLDAGGFGGIAFDAYGIDDYKFAALDIAGQRIVPGHVSRGTLVIDASVARSLAAGTTYTVLVTIKGASVSVVVNGSFAKSMAYNSALADGSFGFLARTGTVHVDELRLRTDGYSAPTTTTTTTTASGFDHDHLWGHSPVRVHDASARRQLRPFPSATTSTSAASSTDSAASSTDSASSSTDSATSSTDSAASGTDTSSDPAPSEGTTEPEPALPVSPTPGRKK